MSDELETMNIEPNWTAMFIYAIAITKSEIAEDKGQAVVTEMLEYGKRLHKATKDGEFLTNDDIEWLYSKYILPQDKRSINEILSERNPSE